MLHISHLRRALPSAASRPELALVAITFLWGATFLIVHEAMRFSGPLFFVGLRFMTAGLLTLFVFRRAMRGLTRRELGAGLAIGVTIVLGYGLQTFGLQTITSSQSAFMTALYVPMVPLLQWLVLRKRVAPMALVGIALAFAGLVMLAGPDASGIAMGPGEWATLLSALAIAAEIILIGRFAGTVDLRRVTVVQLLAAGVFALLLMPATGESLPAFSWVWLLSGAGLGAASALIQLTMNWAQKAVSPTRATLIYASEPVWGGIVGCLAGDRLALLAVLGAALIVLGVVVSELKPSGWIRRRARSAAVEGT